MNTDKTAVPVLEKQAITAALAGNWEIASQLNLQILEEQTDHIPTLNRLAKSHCALGNVEAAKKIYQQVLTLDPENSIADKNLKRLSQLNHQTSSEQNVTKSVSTSQFLKQSGQSKVVKLINLGSMQALASLSAGDSVKLLSNGKLIAVTDDRQRHLGRIPGDISYRLNQFIKIGYQYRACVKSIEESSIQILIQEIQRPEDGKASFL